MSDSSTGRDDLERKNQLRRRAWAKQAPKYDKTIGFFERRVFGTEHRAWACSRARGNTLEVAIGSGLNIPLYDKGVQLTGIDLSREMLELAKARASQAECTVDLQEGDAHSLAFTDGSFDTVVCTYSLCNVPDPYLAVGEMNRVLSPGGRLILVDHIRSGFKPVFWGQKVIEFFSSRLDGDHMTRRPLEHVKAHGFHITERERLGPTGIVERLVGEKQQVARRDRG
jgi:ubiquinone/menaquinone biosynthesis C-methylase UbiE